jgi:hypothetical protein
VWATADTIERSWSAIRRRPNVGLCRLAQSLACHTSVDTNVSWRMEGVWLIRPRTACWLGISNESKDRAGGKEQVRHGSRSLGRTP